MGKKGFPYIQALEKTRESLARKLNGFIGEIKALKQKLAKGAVSDNDYKPSAPDDSIRGESDSPVIGSKSIRQRQAEMTNEEASRTDESAAL